MAPLVAVTVTVPLPLATVDSGRPDPAEGQAPPRTLPLLSVVLGL